MNRDSALFSMPLVALLAVLPAVALALWLRPFAPFVVDVGRAVALIRHSLWLWPALLFLTGFLHA